RLIGPGGFINMSQNARKAVFCGTFTSGGLDVAVENGRIRIITEGKHRKLVERVNQITFNAAVARARGRSALFVTERAVFELDDAGLVLTEIAPGVDLAADILAQAQGSLRVAPTLREMRPEFFRDEPMGLADWAPWNAEGREA
ncbi:MAG: 3-oxoacid CoA-transferase, partial [Thermomicrobiales bacterium]|nr:3-oxoacid CoA-transferase [Thermomicrobiales bacterium]